MLFTINTEKNESIYTLKLFRHGFILPQGLETSFITAKRASDIMNTNIKIIAKEHIQEWYAKQQTNDDISYLIIKNENTVEGILNANIDAFIANTSPDLLIDRNIYWIDSKTKWSNLLRNLDVTKNPIILVTSSLKSKLANDILGVITHREIIRASKDFALLSHV